jgi:hypothetical protein
MMVVARHLNNYELSKLGQGSAYLMDCVQATYRQLYEELT